MVEEAPRQTATATRAPQGDRPAVPVYRAPYDWPAIEESVRTLGAAIVPGIVQRSLVDDFNRELDAWLEANPRGTGSDTGSELYDKFLGRKTLRLHGVPGKIEASHPLITHPEIVASMRRLLAHWSNEILLSLAELIQIGPRESAQLIHRDTGSWWPRLPREEHPWNVTAMIALTPFTEETGATRVVPGSCRWPLGERPRFDQIGRAVMEPGDALFFRGDVLHGGGANKTQDQARRGLALSYCAGWLRPVDNNMLAVPPKKAAALGDELLALLGYVAHDATHVDGGLVGMYDNGDPLKALRSGALD
ncbi:phytanoyl-CoA dioxygenase family protein [Streptomyces prasinopilosus]|uniref:Phytanoyl-CoA dioxygenase (PhyH) n=1 Tax=Streptomyces prasinopilosus TaxID=67344 RepID=A0A1G7ALV4_9ACTN|nr:phytanoyl-CoA dioxygenase family protein [Streptomyces prasinopilosus]SDE15914.1 Phytanoyl-CoA dioxygenase (PhyH) [Streptomyces prasinopilosus]